MNKRFTDLTGVLVLQVCVVGLAQAGAPIDNFPIEDLPAAALKPVVARAQALGIPVNPKKCYLFNPPSIDRQWTVPCEPKAAIAEPMKMCRISNSSGWDAALFTEPCANAEKRKAASGQ